MIGDARAPQRRAKPEPFKKKNGRSFKTIDTHKDMPDDDGDAGTHGVAHRSTHGMKPGTGLPNGPGPKAFTEKRGHGANKLMMDRGTSDGGGSKELSKAACDAWCQGKRSSYK
jgi:hypothetical protein